GPALESRVGRLQDDLRITWFSAAVFANGVAPSVAIVGDDVQEVHTTADGQRRQQVRGTLDRRGRKIEWQAARAAHAAALPRRVADWESHTLRSARDDEGAVGCSFDGGVLTAARDPQVAFVRSEEPTSELP